MRGFTDRDGGRLGALVGVLLAAALAGAARAALMVWPGASVRVGEPVCCDANSFDSTGMVHLTAEGHPNEVKGYYEWDFGDGYKAQRYYPRLSQQLGGHSVLHYFMRPGTFTVTLTVTDVGVAAVGKLYLGGLPLDGETITLDGKVYTWQDVLTDVDGHVLIGTLSGCQTNLRNAVNRTGTPGTGYAASTTVHPTITMGTWVSSWATLTAKAIGVAGNALVIAEDMSNPQVFFDDTESPFTLGTTTAGAEIISRPETREMTVTGDWPKLPPLPATSETLWLKCEDNLNDSSGNALHGTATGAVGYTAVGAEHACLDLDEGEYVTIPDDALLDGMDTLTVSVWARRATAAETGYLLYKQGCYQLAIADSKGVRGYVYTANGSATVYYGALTQIQNTMWHQYALVYNGSFVRLYIDGEIALGTENDKPLTGAVVNNANSLYVGNKGASGLAGDRFAGSLDEVKLFRAALTPDDMARRLELRHAPFHNRTQQRVYAQIPGRYTATAANRLVVQLQGATQDPCTIVNERQNLQSEEEFLIESGTLDADSYALTAKILNDARAQLSETTAEYWVKRYDGLPVVGINADNAFVIDSNLYFPVTPFGLEQSWFSEWTGKINCAYNLSYSVATGYPSTAANLVYLDQVAAQGWRSILSFSWAYGLPLGSLRRYQRNVGLYYFEAAAAEDKDHAALFGLGTGDEPDMGAEYEYRPASLCAARAYRTHMLDDRHPTSTNMSGLYLRSWYNSFRAREYEMRYNAEWFGGHPHAPWEITGQDYYPLHWRLRDNAKVWWLADIIDTQQAMDYGLLPTMAFLECTDISDGIGGTPAPDPNQSRLQAWLAVIHGCKGINWFIKSDHPTVPMYAMMAQFYTDAQALKDIILAPVPLRTVVRTDANNVESNRIDAMVREYAGEIWVFACRVTEVGDANTLTPTLRVSGFTDAVDANVYGESRTVSVVTDGNDAFIADDFEPNAVHIYQFEPNPEGTLPAAGPATQPVPATAATGQARSLTLRWTAGSGAVSHDVYLGTDASPDADAGASEFRGNQPGNTLSVGGLTWSTTYYWRVDEVNANGVRTTGAVWSFTTQARPAKRFLFFR